MVHELAMDPHVALERERFFAFGNVKNWTPWRRWAAWRWRVGIWMTGDGC